MTDAEKEIREALAAGPTPGPWCIHPETDGTEICAVDLVPGLPIRQVIAHPKHGANWIANARLIAACSPANVRELLDEIERLRGLIDAHNADCTARCEAMSKQAGYAGVCIHYTNRGRTCPNCPRDEMIDAARGKE